MTTLTVNNEVTAVATPSQQIIDDANRVVKVTDARGRVIEIKRMKMSIRRRVFKVLSSENGSKEQYLGLALLAACVVSIDDVSVPFPASELQMDALIDRLDDVGFASVVKGIQQNFRQEDERAAAGE